VKSSASAVIISINRIMCDRDMLKGKGVDDVAQLALEFEVHVAFHGVSRASSLTAEVEDGSKLQDRAVDSTKGVEKPGVLLSIAGAKPGIVTVGLNIRVSQPAFRGQLSQSGACTVGRGSSALHEPGANGKGHAHRRFCPKRLKDLLLTRRGVGV
jgi:hypothetical protein